MVVKNSRIVPGFYRNLVIYEMCKKNYNMVCGCVYNVRDNNGNGKNNKLIQCFTSGWFPTIIF